MTWLYNPLLDQASKTASKEFLPRTCSDARCPPAGAARSPAGLGDGAALVAPQLGVTLLLDTPDTSTHTSH